jgi:malic enzyme
MEKLNNQKFSYEDLLREHMGLFKMKIKMPVRDTKALALVYTPGVAASCLEIKTDITKALRYTNKMNSMLVVTDSSGFQNLVDGKDWNNMAAIPYLEAICVFYKNSANIDAYPLVLDFSKVKNESELAECIQAIMPGFSAVEFFSMCPDRLKGCYEIFNSSKNTYFAYFDSNQKRKLDDDLNLKNLNFSSNSLYSLIIRAILDTQSNGNMTNLIEHVIKNVLESKINCPLQVLQSASEYILKNNMSSLKDSRYNLNKEEMSTNYILNKFNKFLHFGEDAWVEEFPHGYHFHKKTNDENSLLLHARYRGVVGTGSKLTLKDQEKLSKLFSWENLDQVSNYLIKEPNQASNLTCKRNLGAIITNGTAILGLGNIGPLSGLPVMEGKSVLFKLYGGTDIIPLCIDELNPDKLIAIVSRITPIFSIINLEDIRSPDCFQIEPQLNSITNFPVFHDDQHGTAVVVLAGMINCLKLKNKKIEDMKIVMNGAGAAGLSVTELLLTYGAKKFIICDTEGAIYLGREKNMNEFKNKLAKMTNFEKEQGKLNEILKGADVFIGLSGPKALSPDMVRSMNSDPIIFALANPTPEIFPDEALEAGAFIVATGRSDFPNQINNSLAFPGIFRAAVDVKAKNITIEMKIAASEAIAGLVSEKRLSREYIIPGALDTAVSMEVCRAVAEVAFKQGENQEQNLDTNLIIENIHSWFLDEKLLNFEHIKKTNVEWTI